MWLRQVSGERRLRAAATRTAGALVATATALTALGAAAPASADVVAPFTKRYDASLYGDFATIGNTVMGCPAALADLTARCAAAGGGRGGGNDTFVTQRVNTAGTTAGYGSSTGRVTIPPGAKVAYAPAPPALRITSVPERPAAPPCEETGNTVTIADFSARKRTGVAVEWPVTAGSAPVASAGSVTKRGAVYVWKGDVAAHGEVVITQRVKASCTAGRATVITVTADVPRTNCPKARPGEGDPCTSVITARREQARPAPPHEAHGSALADTGDSDRFLYGGLAAALCTLGVLAVAAARSRRY
ncbi:hypothetical protein [Streptomyces sp. NPDC056949]|uniref:hypothetical protein n=1 Tax=Streptomyces sp. NPDC056949 TaxID=3345976 RepID=UPI003644624B